MELMIILIYFWQHSKPNQMYYLMIALQVKCFWKKNTNPNILFIYSKKLPVSIREIHNKLYSTFL